MKAGRRGRALPGLPSPQERRRGDLSSDCVVDFGDVDPFVLTLSNPVGYRQQYPNCDIMNGDINGDSVVNFDDINPFVALLIGGGQ